MEMYSECWSLNVGAFDFIIFDVKSERPSMWTLNKSPSPSPPDSLHHLPRLPRGCQEDDDGESEEGEATFGEDFSESPISPFPRY